MAKRKRLRAHLCNPPSCERITLREKCDRCRALDAERQAQALLHGIAAKAGTP